MVDYITRNSEQFKCVKVNVDDFPKSHFSINEPHLDLIDVFKPVKYQYLACPFIPLLFETFFLYSQ